jgi:RNA polymerase sigma factor (sigma-70 family)
LSGNANTCYRITVMDERVDGLLPLAARIAREFSNIPGLPFAEIELSAQEALANAARLFDAKKGDFTPYAARAITNALRDLYERQKRHHHHHQYILDEPIPSGSATTAEARIHGIPSPASPPADHAAIHESRERLEIAMNGLPTRLRTVSEGIRDGKSYTEIGNSLGISKQAAHKLAGAAITSIRESLARMGYTGIDTLGLLKSGSNILPSTSTPPWDDGSPPQP